MILAAIAVGVFAVSWFVAAGADPPNPADSFSITDTLATGNALWTFLVGVAIVFAFRYLNKKGAIDASDRASAGWKNVYEAEVVRRKEAEDDLKDERAEKAELITQAAKLADRSDMRPLFEALRDKWADHTREHKAIMDSVEKLAKATERLHDQVTDEAVAHDENTRRIVDTLGEVRGAITRIAPTQPGGQRHYDPPKPE